MPICLLCLENTELIGMATPAEARGVYSAELSKNNDSDTRRERRPRPLILPILVTSRERPNERLSPRLQVQINLLDKQECAGEELCEQQRRVDQASGFQSIDTEQAPKREGEVRRKRQPWKGRRVKVMPSGGGVRLDGGPVMSEGEASLLESDVSSVISISDRLVLSDSEEDDVLHDKQKYRLPEFYR